MICFASLVERKPQDCFVLTHECFAQTELRTLCMTGKHWCGIGAPMPSFVISSWARPKASSGMT